MFVLCTQLIELFYFRYVVMVTLSTVGYGGKKNVFLWGIFAKERI